MHEYDLIADWYASDRGECINPTGVPEVTRLAASLAPRSRVLDVGCGNGVPLTRILLHAGHQVVGLDSSAKMLERFRLNLPGAPAIQGLAQTCAFADQSFDAVLSKDLLHHLPDPMVLWREVRRLGRPGAAIYVMDLLRPDTEEDARAMVKEGAGSEHPILQRDFYQSLLAAFTMDEVRAQVASAGLDLTVGPIGVRHMLIAGTLPS